MPTDDVIRKANQALTRLSHKLHTDCIHVDEANECAADVALVRAGLGAAFADGERETIAHFEDRLEVAFAGVHERLARIERVLMPAPRGVLIIDAGKVHASKRAKRTRKKK